jgi:hypothetical protein
MVRRTELEEKAGWPALMKDQKNLRMTMVLFIRVFIVRVLPDINASFCMELFRYLHEGRVPPWEWSAVRDSGSPVFKGRRVLLKRRREWGGKFIGPDTR